MKKRSQKVVCIFLALLLVAVVGGCKWYSLDFLVHKGDGDGSRGGSGGAPLGVTMINISGATVTAEPQYEATDDSAYGGINANGPFLSAYLPVTVDSFRIAETELTYEKWSEVYNWAVKHRYSFEHEGCNGKEGLCGRDPQGPNQPVVGISWRDAVVWCNAASEREGLNPVYLFNGEVLRTSRTFDADYCSVSSAANGYRLPTSAEWEYAVRGGKTTEIEWNYQYAGTNNEGELPIYAVYDLDDSIESNNTSPVKTKLPNSCGLYDMSGNVFEFCFDSCYGDSSARIARGGRWCEGSWAASMGNCIHIPSDMTDWGYGFRVAQNGTPDSSPAVPAGFVKITGAKVAKRPTTDTGGSFYGVVQGAPATYIPINTFYMAETELKYQRWYEVRQWALVHGYTFYSVGKETNNSHAGTAPLDMNSAVTNISWRDAVVWCNAASEMDGLTPVYWLPGTTDFTDAAKVLREAESDTVANGSGKAENAVFNQNANGYRLPTEEEWEYAARGGNQNLADWDFRWAGTDESWMIDQYAAYDRNSALDYVGKYQANAAGLYDMTGFQYEFCWKMNGTYPSSYRGGNYQSTADNSQIDVIPSSVTPLYKLSGIGFRVVRSSVESGSSIGPRNIAMNMVLINGETVTTSIGSGAFETASSIDVVVENFYIADSEMTYAMWKDVRDWALSHGYSISAGQEGTDGLSGAQSVSAEPVTNISFRDVVIWCNAASEKEGLSPVYYQNGTSDFSNSAALLKTADSTADTPAENTAANGYRLPNSTEWEYAARGGNPSDTTSWEYIYSGTGDSVGLSNYAVFNTTDTALVKSKKPNTMGLFDMCGNVCEMVYTNGVLKYCGGGYDNSADFCEIDGTYSCGSDSVDSDLGFRVVRNAN